MNPRAGGAGRAPWIVFVLTWGALAALLVGVASVPAVPYNVRELFAGPRGWLAAIALPVVAALGVGAPGAAIAWMVPVPRRAMLVPLFAVVCALVAFGLLRAAVPVESIWDIVGYPVLNGPGDWEICGRFVALFTVVWTLIAGSAALAIAIDSGAWRIAIAGWLPWGLPFLVAGYFVIVPWAATDNLTELMRGGGAPGGAAALAGWFLVVGSAASLASRALAGLRADGAARRWGIAAAATVLSYPAAYLLVTLGTAERIEKYGATFSALQFLLSPDREHYVSGPPLLLLYAFAQSLALGGIALAQLPAWLAARR